MGKLGPRPDDPSKISFSADCFVADGETVSYETHNKTGWGYPKRHATREAAEVHGRRCRQTVQEVRTPRLVRIKWF